MSQSDQVDIEDMSMDQLYDLILDSGRRINLDAMQIYDDLGQRLAETFEEWAMEDDLGVEFNTQLANIVREGKVQISDASGIYSPSISQLRS